MTAAVHVRKLIRLPICGMESNMH